MRRAPGFTLLELLVALSILGVLMLAVNALQTGTLTVSARANSQADRYRDLTDATGYLADVIRQADNVYTNVSLSTATGEPSAVALATAACALPATGTNPPCFAVRIPVSSSSSTNAITQYRYLAYRFVAHSSLPVDATGVIGWKTTDAWADAHVYAVVEYSCTENVSGSTPTDPCTLTGSGSAVSAIAGLKAALVTDDLTLDAYPSGTLTPFEYDGTSQFTLRLRTAYSESGSGSTRYVPGDRAYEVRVMSRNR